MESRIKEHMQT